MWRSAFCSINDDEMEGTENKSGALTAGAAIAWGLMRWYAWLALAGGLLVLLLVLGLWASGAYSWQEALGAAAAAADVQLFTYLAVGFAAQLIDGSLGMAYGVSSTSFLMSAGVSPAIASANVHVAEVFTTAISGISHWRMGNVDRKLFLQLALPGALGAGLGAYALSSFDGAMIKPWVSLYLLVMGIVVIRKARYRVMAQREYKRPRLLALFGGFIDASGGGGWGPIVTSTLLGSGNNPRLTIGTVNAVEFLVAFTASGIFSLSVGTGAWQIIAGLVLGGALAAPLGAYLCRYINARYAMLLVGALIIVLSLRSLWLAWL